jgi:hypothetical protein
MSAAIIPLLEVVGLARGNARSLALVLTCFLDDSDAELSRVMTIAGYVADLEAWKQFEIDAEAICADQGVGIIHGRELDARKDCFKGWTVPKTAAFLSLLGDALGKAKAFGISRSVPKELYKRQKAELKLVPNMGAYGFGFGTIVHTLQHESPFGERAKAEGVAYLVESGHPNNPDLVDRPIQMIP